MVSQTPGRDDVLCLDHGAVDRTPVILDVWQVRHVPQWLGLGGLRVPSPHEVCAGVIKALVIEGKQIAALAADGHTTHWQAPKAFGGLS
jgi:hypothetical protein